MKNEEDAENASITERVSNAKKSIGKVDRSARNDFKKYNYATVDDIYDAVRNILAKQNLDLIISQKNFEIINQEKQSWIKIDYEIGFAGEEPQNRTQIVLNSGPQSIEAALSYTQKQYLRARLQISTGEVEDVDQSAENKLPAKTNKDVNKNLSEKLNEGRYSFRNSLKRPTWLMQENYKFYPSKECSMEEKENQRTFYTAIARAMHQNPAHKSEIFSENMDLIEALPAGGQSELEKIRAKL